MTHGFPFMMNGCEILEPMWWPPTSNNSPSPGLSIHTLWSEAEEEEPDLELQAADGIRGQSTTTLKVS